MQAIYRALALATFSYPGTSINLCKGNRKVLKIWSHRVPTQASASSSSHLGKGWGDVGPLHCQSSRQSGWANFRHRSYLSLFNKRSSQGVAW